MRVFVYFNLHKKLWSVKALEGPDRGKVIAHRLEVGLEDVEFRVSEAGRQRVLHERRKNVHAGVVGRLTGISFGDCMGHPVTYNPYKHKSFVKKYAHTPIKYAAQAYMIVYSNNKGAVYV